jgi:hypothetical protein
MLLGELELKLAQLLLCGGSSVALWCGGASCSNETKLQVGLGNCFLQPPLNA